LTWLRNGQDKSLDPTGAFAQIYSTLPKKRGQTRESRAQDITNSLKWMRNRGLTNEGDDDYESFKKVGQKPSGGFCSPEERAKDREDALNWLHKKGAGGDDPDGIFMKLDTTLPRKAGQTYADRAGEIALNWLHNKGTAGDDPDGVFMKLDITLPRKAGQSFADRAREMENALHWLRQQGLDLDMDDDFSSLFKKVRTKSVSTFSPSDWY
jgi:hypothetical protein